MPERRGHENQLVHPERTGPSHPAGERSLRHPNSFPQVNATHPRLLHGPPNPRPDTPVHPAHKTAFRPFAHRHADPVIAVSGSI